MILKVFFPALKRVYITGVRLFVIVTIFMNHIFKNFGKSGKISDQIRNIDSLYNINQKTFNLWKKKSLVLSRGDGGAKFHHPLPYIQFWISKIFLGSLDNWWLFSTSYKVRSRKYLYLLYFKNYSFVCKVPAKTFVSPIQCPYKLFKKRMPQFSQNLDRKYIFTVSKNWEIRKSFRFFAISQFFWKKWHFRKFLT